MTTLADNLKIGSLELTSRVFLGTSQYPDPATLLRCIEASGTELVTVGIRRVDLADNNRHSLMNLLRNTDVNFLPNTAGCFTAKEAVLTAELARAALNTNRIKLEVIGDDHSLYPDSVELLKAAETLIKTGFEVYPYCTDDVVLCRRLADLGCMCVMPLASPIGSGRGLQNPHNFQLIRNKIEIPIVVDAGIGTASDVCRAFELGLDAILLNTAVAKAGYPEKMASAVKHAALAGREAFAAKRIPVKDYAEASTSNDGKINFYQMKK
jgi:thiazole synthase